MSKNMLTLSKLLKEIINEVGDLKNIKPFPYNLESVNIFFDINLIFNYT
jgi:hypothetical protein